MSWLSDLFKKKATVVQSPQSSFSMQQARELAQSMSMVAVVSDPKSDLEVANITNTNSMLPMLDANAFVVLEHAAYEDLEVGDLITWFATDGRRMLHPIIDHKPGGFWTKGINNANPDPQYVSRSNFDKRVVAIVYAKHTNETRL